MSQLSDALAGIPNAHEPVPGVITGGQPTRAQLEAFQAAGGRLVIDVRDPMEQRPFDEPAVARELGLTYVNVPVSPDATSDEKMNALLETLRTHDGEPTLFHCASGNRLGGPLIAWLMSAMGEGWALTTAKVTAAFFGVALHLSAVHRAVALLAVFYLLVAVIPGMAILFMF